MTTATLVGTPDPDDNGEKQAEQIEVLIFGRADDDPRVGILMDPVTALQMVSAWTGYNRMFIAKPGREQWVAEVGDIARAAIQIETLTGALPPADVRDIPFSLHVVRDIGAEERGQVGWAGVTLTGAEDLG
ncbi:MAG: hypothetical protein JWO46_2442 [Nocardioidaceae bacterium]|nr:hypothetical protein [Nocardioidaceae bacterium]